MANPQAELGTPASSSTKQKLASRAMTGGSSGSGAPQAQRRVTKANVGSFANPNAARRAMQNMNRPQTPQAPRQQMWPQQSSGGYRPQMQSAYGGQARPMNQQSGIRYGGGQQGYQGGGQYPGQTQWWNQPQQASQMPNWGSAQFNYQNGFTPYAQAQGPQGYGGSGMMPSYQNPAYQNTAAPGMQQAISQQQMLNSMPNTLQQMYNFNQGAAGLGYSGLGIANNSGPGQMFQGYGQQWGYNPQGWNGNQNGAPFTGGFQLYGVPGESWGNSTGGAARPPSGGSMQTALANSPWTVGLVGGPLRGWGR